jgi:hypothetical protein
MLQIIATSQLHTVMTVSMYSAIIKTFDTFTEQIESKHQRRLKCTAPETGASTISLVEVTMHNL